MKNPRAADVVYRYSRNHATREQLVAALRACSNPVSSCRDCVFYQMKSAGCIVRLMDEAAHMLEVDHES